MVREGDVGLKALVAIDSMTEGILSVEYRRCQLVCPLVDSE